jgi:hypothetical protein
MDAATRAAIRRLDGVPDVDLRTLPCDRLIADGAEYMRRYYLSYGRSRHARFHHIVASDPQPDLHDHPWDFVSKLLTGTYIEHTPDGTVTYTAPCTIVRKAEHLHQLELPDGPVWSYVVTGRLRRTWGFATEGGWQPWNTYREAGGVAGCQPPDSAIQPGKRRYL